MIENDFNFDAPEKLAATVARIREMLGHSWIGALPTKHPDKCSLAVITPSGVKLGVIELSYYDGDWKFGGTSSFLPEKWNDLCAIGAPPKFIDYTDPRIKP